MSDEEKEKFIAEKEKELKQQVKTLYLASAWLMKKILAHIPVWAIAGENSS
jgi:hypothetical protein